MISDGFGEAYEDAEEAFVADMGHWLSRRARGLCQSPQARSRLDEVQQEGRIELWRAYRESGDAHQAQSRAFYRMREVAWREPRLTGQEPRAAHTVPPADLVSVDGTPDYVLQEFETFRYLDDVEFSYHHGEIMQALNALTPKQRQYVYARFWCGIDMPAGSRNEGIKQAKQMNPILSRDVLWTGNKTTKGAKKTLAELLEHLQELVAS